MIHKTTLTVLAAVLILAGSQAKSAYSQTSAVAPTPQSESTQQPDRINLTAEQKAQFKTIHQSIREQLMALRSDQTLSPEQRKAKARSIREGAHQQILGMLTPQQQELVKNNRRERGERGMGRGFAHDGGDRAALGLTADQRSQLKSIHQSTREQVNGIRNDSTLTSEQKAEKIRSLHQGVRQQVSGILTPEQREKLKEGHRNRHHHGPGLFGGPGGRRGGVPSGSPSAEKP
jgi:protein CpxP